ncbi:hypothetical protein V6N13_135873 [Hibiscus sabdariffa]|uniref:Uncharacterized protein n=1 Tax=Hibiscus sabdariffa TaxID=183260 RepID=A0ABR2QTI6_9ROSI
MEARQLQFIEETKVFKKSLINFLCLQFLLAATFFKPPSPPAANNSAAHLNGENEGTEEVHYSSNAEPDSFDWQTPFEAKPPSLPAAPRTIPPPTPHEDVAESSQAKKRKKPADRRTQVGIPSDASDDSDDLPALPEPRRRRYHVISCDSDDDSSTANPPAT